MQKKKILSKLAVIALLIFAVWFYRDSMGDILNGIRQIKAWQMVICTILATIYFLLDGMLIFLATRELTGNVWRKILLLRHFCVNFTA